jgi:hypothetical protein
MTGAEPCASRTRPTRMFHTAKLYPDFRIEEGSSLIRGLKPHVSGTGPTGYTFYPKRPVCGHQRHCIETAQCMDNYFSRESANWDRKCEREIGFGEYPDQESNPERLVRSER